ncbi:coatomer subunit zeta-1-like isoform X2 [Pomacea canaliculata]|uniref:coatomer subunit zeta-1-like isoform X2 n=1 Tax=Pomacea canaliculata TaxID=400727 RepID=UPI000D73AFCB|nr:coatomer subunit zeta-1-like isoform X2 [Pomacea canaliculata]
MDGGILKGMPRTGSDGGVWLRPYAPLGEYRKEDVHPFQAGKQEPSLYSIKALAILDNDGNRLFAKYYDETFPTAKEQKAFEKNLFNKTHRANAEIVMFEGMTCVYRSNVDLFFYVVGSSQENELILASVLNAFYDSISQILRKNVEKRALLDNMDAIFLAADEICDGGILLEADPNAVVQKVAIRNEDIPLGEQTVAQVLQSAKEQIKWSLLK